MKGITHKELLIDSLSPPEAFVTVPTEPDESQDLITHWQNFIEGDSALDLIDNLNDVFTQSSLD